MEEWERIDPMIGQIVREGVYPAWESNPPPRMEGRDSLHCCESSENKVGAISLVQNEIDSLMTGGVIERVPIEEEECENEVVSQMFLVTKKSGGERPVLNLKPLNRFTHYQHFKMEGLKTARELIREKDFMVTVDLKDAYHHVPSIRRRNGSSDSYGKG
ncbi:MAG: hypothetical protein ACREHG_02210 [Candidatus Saccharimonadales bacterium]